MRRCDGLSRGHAGWRQCHVCRHDLHGHELSWRRRGPLLSGCGLAWRSRRDWSDGSRRGQPRLGRIPQQHLDEPLWLRDDYSIVRDLL